MNVFNFDVLKSGMIATEMCHQMSENVEYFNIILEKLIMFESSHKVFHLGVYANCKQFGMHVSNEYLFRDPKIYCGSMSIYLSTLIGCDSKKRIEMYNFCVNRSPNSLDDAIKIAFEFAIENSLCIFESEKEMSEMKAYLRYLLIKSNAGLIYTYDTNNKLKIPVFLFKSKNFFYKNHMNSPIYYVDSVSGVLTEFKIDSNDFSLNEIVIDEKNLSIIQCSNGNHWTLVSENLDEITDFLKKILNPAQSKL